MKNRKESRRGDYTKIALLFASLLLLSFVDFIVLEKIHHPITSNSPVSWADFEVSVFDRNLPILWWYVAFFPLAIFLFILLGVAAKSWRLALSGIILFATGWEDILYYLIQFKWIPPQLAWLDYNPFIAWTKVITATEHTTNFNLILSSIFGAIIVGTLFLIYKFKKKAKKKK